MTAFARIIMVKADTWLAKRHTRQMLLASTATPRQRRADRVRYWFAAVLAFVAVVTLMEVVIAPGSMIRNHLRPAHSNSSSTAGQTSTREDRAGTGGPVQKQGASERSDVSLQRERLESLYAALDAEWASFQRDVERRVGVNPATADPKVLPPSLGDIIPAKPTASVAWADIQQAAPVVVKQLSHARQTIKDIPAGRKPDPSQGSEDSRVLDAIDELEQAQRSLQRMRTELEHLAFLRQAPTRPGGNGGN
jgi:hypothetical protein